MTRGFSMIRHGLPVIALAFMGYSLWTVAANYSARAVTEPPVAAPANPFTVGVAGSGIVEPASEVISLAIERGGVVVKVYVIAGTRVKAGDPLFAIDDRNYRGRVAETAAAIAAAAAELSSIDQSLILQRDMIAQSDANRNSAAAEVTRAGLDQGRYAVLSRNASAPRQRSETADADLRKANAGRAAADAAFSAARRQTEVLVAHRAEADAKLTQAKAVLEQAQADLDKTVVRAPIDGAVLKVNVRVGEYAASGMLATPLMTMGDVATLHVRADIDESDAWRIHPEQAAWARLRGNPAVATRLSFVRFEPYILPKRSLTDTTTERVDTRVLQIIYAFSPANFPAFVGEQVDVFIESKDKADVLAPKTASSVR